MEMEEQKEAENVQAEEQTQSATRLQEVRTTQEVGMPAGMVNHIEVENPIQVEMSHGFKEPKNEDGYQEKGKSEEPKEVTNHFGNQENSAREFMSKFSDAFCQNVSVNDVEGMPSQVLYSPMRYFPGVKFLHLPQEPRFGSGCHQGYENCESNEGEVGDEILGQNMEMLDGDLLKKDQELKVVECMDASIQAGDDEESMEWEADKEVLEQYMRIVIADLVKENEELVSMHRSEFQELIDQIHAVRDSYKTHIEWLRTQGRVYFADIWIENIELEVQIEILEETVKSINQILNSKKLTYLQVLRSMGVIILERTEKECARQVKRLVTALASLPCDSSDGTAVGMAMSVWNLTAQHASKVKSRFLDICGSHLDELMGIDHHDELHNLMVPTVLIPTGSCPLDNILMNILNKKKNLATNKPKPPTSAHVEFLPICTGPSNQTPEYTSAPAATSLDAPSSPISLGSMGAAQSASGLQEMRESQGVGIPSGMSNSMKVEKPREVEKSLEAAEPIEEDRKPQEHTNSCENLENTDWSGRDVKEIPALELPTRVMYLVIPQYHYQPRVLKRIDACIQTDENWERWEGDERIWAQHMKMVIADLKKKNRVLATEHQSDVQSLRNQLNAIHDVYSKNILSLNENPRERSFENTWADRKAMEERIKRLEYKINAMNIDLRSKELNIHDAKNLLGVITFERTEKECARQVKRLVAALSYLPHNSNDAIAVGKAISMWKTTEERVSKFKSEFSIACESRRALLLKGQETLDLMVPIVQLPRGPCALDNVIMKLLHGNENSSLNIPKPQISADIDLLPTGSIPPSPASQVPLQSPI